MDEDIEYEEDEEEELAEKPKKRIDFRKKILDNSDNYLNSNECFDAEEKLVDYTTGRIRMYPSQKEFVKSVQAYLGFGLTRKTAFVRYAVLSFCREQNMIREAKRSSDLKFIKAYDKFRTKYLVEKNNINEKIAKLRAMAPPQDGGGDPFSEEDLFE